MEQHGVVYSKYTVCLCTQSTATTTMASYRYIMISEDQKKLILTMQLSGHQDCYRNWYMHYPGAKWYVVSQFL